MCCCDGVCVSSHAKMDGAGRVKNTSEEHEGVCCCGGVCVSRPPTASLQAAPPPVSGKALVTIAAERQ